MARPAVGAGGSAGCLRAGQYLPCRTVGRWHIQHIRNLRRHPFTFYQKCGFTIVGVVPDANGPGKPDILMAKRVAGTR